MTDAPQVLLEHHLKKLKLPTFLSEHDKLARQCAAEDKGHVQYLLRLCELELHGGRLAASHGIARNRVRGASAGWSSGGSLARQTMRSIGEREGGEVSSHQEPG